MSNSIADLESEPGLFLSNKEVNSISVSLKFSLVLSKLFSFEKLIFDDVIAFFPFHWQKVFSEAEEMAKRYRRKLPVFATRKLDPLPAETLAFDDESRLYSNWKWFKFERGN